ncbi:exonuclease domain-containing protein [Algoriphagus machipongonensis]|uniref:DNA polymerase III, epsilon subunit n=1 Tax=Algoriphagus machipongonensis TaxID=388413 RepID=A3HRT4_9BACT|nr:exonuclease domain-containing protein [Algoriphagus machipongonensis]EAZ82552.1 DNA polymerase III, epsilon subunit [Algoriphagus machipongonensis]
MEFAIVDIETTGGAASTCGITEIAILIHDGEKVIEEFESLINPEQDIPTYITGLTGIDNSMVSDAPTFEELSDKLWDLLHGRVFVAHSVNFDYGFVRACFNAIGREFKVDKLCTVRLARKIIPGLSSYSLGRICETQKIPILARHRAMGDARATAILFDQMLKKDSQTVFQALKKNSGEAFLPPNFPITKYRKIPEACGVYYMMNEKGNVVYVGKAINIKERFKNHFSGQLLPSLKQKLKEEVVDLKWEITGTEFLALLLEALEIKRIWPKYNNALKLPKTMWGLFHYEDNSGFSRFQIAKVTKHLRPLESFFSSDEAHAFLKEAIDNFDLCPRLCGIRKAACKPGDYNSCQGECFSQSKPNDYNLRVAELVARIKESQKEILLTIPGKSEEEYAACVFDRGILSKYGFYSDASLSETEILGKLEPVPSVPETFYILKQFIPTFKPEQIKVLDSVL